MKALIVDDTKPLRELLQSFVEELDYEVHTASDGQEGLKYMREYGQSVDLIVSDIQMPRLNGPAMLKAICDENLDSKAKYLVVSGAYDDQQLEQ